MDYHHVANPIARSINAMRYIYAITAITILLGSIATPVMAGDTLMDLLNKDSRAAYLDKSESQRIQYEERANSYLDELYNMAIDFSDPELQSLAYDPHVEDVKVPPKPGDTSLHVDTNATKDPTIVETKSGSKFSSGGSLDVQSPSPSITQ